jgi:hypothetical protein
VTITEIFCKNIFKAIFVCVAMFRLKKRETKYFRWRFTGPKTVPGLE